MESDMHNKYQQQSVDIDRELKEYHKIKLYISYPEPYSKLSELALNIRRQEIVDDVLYQLNMITLCLTKSHELIREYDKNSLEYLMNRIDGLRKCNVIYFADGWQKDKVCCIEYDIANKYHKKIICAKES